MSKLIFKDLYLFSPSEKLAKKISFAPGRTMITSDAHDGTDRGKSVIMKALYHTMGADCYFEGKWDDSSKTYILRFCVDDDEYYSIMEIDLKISEYEAEYSQWLSKLRKYEESINIASTEINDILKHEGFIDIKESVAEDLDTIRNSISENEKKLREVKKSLRKYGEIKKKINERYYALMLSDKNRFGLEGINAKSFENIKRTFSAGGSNNPLSTIIWYVNLIQLKHEFNPSAIDFPVVFDSPNNAETDETKKRQIYSYICERITENQLIVSGLGFSGDEILD